MWRYRKKLTTCNKEEGPDQNSPRLAPWCQISSFQNYEKYSSVIDKALGLQCFITVAQAKTQIVSFKSFSIPVVIFRSKNLSSWLRLLRWALQTVLWKDFLFTYEQQHIRALISHHLCHHETLLFYSIIANMLGNASLMFKHVFLFFPVPMCSRCHI